MVYTSGGTHRSRPTNHMGSPLVFVGRHLRVPPCRMRDGFSPHCGESVPAAGHIGPALRDHANPLPAGLRGLWPSHRNNAKHGLRTLPHPFRTAAPNHYKNSKSLNLKVLLDFFQKIVGSRGKAPVARRNGRNPPGGGLPYCSGSQKLRFRSTPPSMPETVPSLVYCHIWKS